MVLKVVKWLFCVFEKGHSDAQKRFPEGAQMVYWGAANGSCGGLKMVIPMPENGSLTRENGSLAS